MIEPGQRYLTVSVDDGHPTDLRTADLLARFDLAATFYVPVKNPQREVLPPNRVRELAGGFEIGGHTLNHRTLRGLDRAALRREVIEGKAWTDDLLGKASVAFCYPRGKFDAAAMAAVRDAGYLGARTCRLNLTKPGPDPFACGVSTQAYAHPAHVQVRHALVEGNVAGAWGFFTVFGAARDWSEHFSRAVDHVDRHGGVAHLYLHSWEIDANDDWVALERTLRNAAGRSSFRYVDNGTLFKALAGRTGSDAARSTT